MATAPAGLYLLIKGSLLNRVITLTMSTRIPLIYGAASFGAKSPQSVGARINTLEDAQQVIDLFVSHGHKGLDTSRIYGAGSSEEFLGQLDLKGCAIDTKAFPGRPRAFSPGGFAPDKLRVSLEQSLKALGKHKIRTFFLHCPDRSVPIEDTLRAVNEFHREGHFEEFGLSNYNSWEVAEIACIATVNGWVKPTVYEGVYNAVERNVEIELFPCLRHFGIRFSAYSPLAGGLLTGKILSEDDMQNASGSRWDISVSPIAQVLRTRYAPLLPVLRELKAITDKYNIRLSEVAQRWLQHHSGLQPTDAIIIGASSISQLETNLKECAGGPLPDDILGLLEDAWKQAKSVAPHYAF
ncbi:Aldo/keto reductase [Leucogyrophana mollusca]|uniref:Aldo/keto reductase n=1 Tax=Leucogyrophana mollusca TaxID=85980 RepID=A0ACB8BLA8_9AGAM|nr:Aldo/keto reductase [Leucogyrophana mollusca]